MKTSNCFAAVALAATAVVAPVQAATATAASMSLQALANLDGSEDANTSTSAWGPLLSPLGVGASASVADAAGNSISVAGYGNASWLSDDKGGVSFEGYGWDIAVTDRPAAANLNGALPDWSYSFTAGASDGQIAVDYRVGGYGYTFGLWGWSIRVAGGPEGVQALPVSNAFDPTGAGSFVALLTPGSLYTTTLENNANLFAESGLSTVGSMNGTFDWQIQQVPEPQTYALLALGLLDVGVAMRRRRA